MQNTFSMRVRAGIAGGALFLLAWAGACSDDDATAPNDAPAALPAAVQGLRASLAPYSSLNLAKAAGYSTAITDCMSNGDEGAMGVHFGNTALIDGAADAAHPEVLIYEPGTNGQMSLVGVEFVVPFAVIPKTGTPPVLFGERFVPNDVFGLWTLHVWTHRANPSGLFSEWNPRVSC
jgi:hypothetical protein